LFVGCDNETKEHLRTLLKGFAILDIDSWSPAIKFVHNGTREASPCAVFSGKPEIHLSAVSLIAAGI